jgi:hypothetical protein
MRELLLMIIVPPVVGLATYAILRLIWKRQEEADQTARLHQLDPK